MSVTPLYPKELDQWFAFCSKQAGRDKVLRAVQYAAKAGHWHMVSNDADKELAAKTKAFSKTLSNSRKLFRIGKWLDAFVKSYEFLMAKQGATTSAEVERWVNIAKNFSGGIYYWLDMLQWFHFAKVWTSSDKKALDKLRNWMWVYRIVFTLAAVAFKYKAHAAKEDKARAKGDTVEVAKLAPKRNKIIRDAVKGVCDFFCPTTSLGYFEFHDGIIGALGFTSSVVGAYDEWPAAK